MSTQLKQTPLHQWHVAAGANMADFGGYTMPLWYPAGVKKEHLAVLTGAGLFDTSHMAVIAVDGPDALMLLQQCFTKDLTACIGPRLQPLEPGRCVYGAFLNPRGGVIDDAIIYHVASEAYLIVVNAGMGAPITAHLMKHRDDRAVDLTDLTDQLAKIDLQGPAAAKILAPLLAAPETVFDKMPYFSFKGHFDPHNSSADTVRLKNGTPLLLSRTGYTGEFGFEMLMAPEHAERVWQLLLEAGQSHDLTVCGLAARDSLRGGAVLPLSHQDIGDWPFINHPWPFALPYDRDDRTFTKSFVGGAALEETVGAPFTYAFIGKDLRKVAAGDETVVTDVQKTPIGKVLTCVTDMGIARHQGRVYSINSPDAPEDFKPRGLCCGFVKVNTQLQPDDQILLQDNRRKIKVTITKDIRPDRTARKPLKDML